MISGANTSNNTTQLINNSSLGKSQYFIPP